MIQNSRLVYSSDPKRNQKCAKCKELIIECRCEPEIEVNSRIWVAVLRIEKAGRSGKTVSVIDQLPQSEAFLKELCTHLKKKCGSGGTYLTDGSKGVVEIQGDHRKILREELLKKGLKVKG